MNFTFKALLPLVITFFILSVIIVLAMFLYASHEINYLMVMIGNGLFFLISLFVFRLQYMAMYNINPNVFIRSVIGGMLIKVIACVILVVAYYFISGAAFNKPAVYLSMVIYIVYLVVEVGTIMKLNKTKNA